MLSYMLHARTLAREEGAQEGAQDNTCSITRSLLWGWFCFPGGFFMPKQWDNVAGGVKTGLPCMEYAMFNVEHRPMTSG